MKPAPFEYFAPSTLDEALELLSRHGDEAKVLAGGQSLMPLLNLRLARPKILVDINRLRDLARIEAASDGGLVVGALARHRAVEKSPLVRQRNPLLAACMPLVGHFQVRNRGTLGGSLVHADPAAELPAVSLLFGCEFTLVRRGGARILRAAEFFRDYLTTAIEPTELLTEVRFPPWRTGAAWAIDEIARRHGDFALVGVALTAELDGEARLRNGALVMFGVGGVPQRIEGAAALLEGCRAEPPLFVELERLVAAALDPGSDIHASAQYRKQVGGVLARRGLQSALARWHGGAEG